MEWYLKVVRDNYANFTGRARRQEYWMFVLFNMIFIFVLAIISGILSGAFEAPGFIIIYVLYVLAVLIPSLAVAVRRLHDTGKSGWFYLVALIPFVGSIWLIILFATEGDVGPNAYGPDPKRPNSDDINRIGNSTHI